MHIRNPFEWLFAHSDPAAIGSARPAEYWPARALRQTKPEARKITLADLRDAIALGVRDFSESRTDVLFVCLIYPIAAFFIAGADADGKLLPLLFPTASGFALLGPFCAIGLYEMSRRREITGQMRWLDVTGVIRSPSIGAIAGLGVLLIALFLAWLVAAEGIYNITLGPRPPASTAAFLHAVLTTPHGWAMIALGVLVGAVFAVAVLAISVVSFPLLLDRPVSLRTAIATSLQALQRNPVPLLLWGLLVAVVGALPIFIGLIVVLPVLGHASWHLYRKLIPS